MGQFNSLVICPDCGTEVSNDEDFLQLTVPIKAKGKKQYYNYGVVMTPYATTYGRAEVLGSWEDIFKNVGVPQNCILLGGNESG